VAALLVLQALDVAALARGRVSLLSGDVETARRSFETARWSPAAWRRGRAGLALCDAIEARPVRARPTLQELVALNAQLIVNKYLTRGDFGAAERLAELADALPGSALYRSAAELEQGRTREARATLATLPGLAGAPLYVRIERALRLEDAGRPTAVFDHQGEWIGSVDAAGRTSLGEGVESTLIPSALLPRLAQTAGWAGVRVSLDLELSRLARRALGELRGSVVLMDLHTGAVLAAVSDDRTLAPGGSPALEQLREPASIAKLITTTAALRSGLDPDAEIRRMRCRGSVHYPGGVLWCPASAGTLRGLAQAMALSCNTSFAQLGALVGRERLLREFRRYGFRVGDPTEGGEILQPRGDARQLADLSIGLEATAITPLHAARLAAVFGNGGSMPETAFVTHRDGHLGLSPVALPHSPPEQIVESAWMPSLREAMLAVAAPGGTGAGLAPRGFPVAMKTGTAATPGEGYHVNYIGVGPMPEPRIAFCVRVTHQRSSRRVRRAARAVTSALLAGLAGRVGYAPALPHGGAAGASRVTSRRP